MTENDVTKLLFIIDHNHDRADDADYLAGVVNVLLQPCTVSLAARLTEQPDAHLLNQAMLWLLGLQEQCLREIWALRKDDAIEDHLAALGEIRALAEVVGDDLDEYPEKRERLLWLIPILEGLIARQPEVPENTIPRAEQVAESELAH